MQVAIIAAVVALVAFAAGVEASKSVLKLAGGIVAAAIADAHAVVAGGESYVLESKALGARVSALEHRAVADVKAEVAKV